MNLKPFTCRFCLVSEGKSVNLFDHDLLLNVNLQSWISQNFGLKIDEKDGLSTDVCVTCLIIVYQTYFFIRKCRESEEILTHKSKSNAGEECIVSSSSGAKSDLSRKAGSRVAVQSPSTSATHLLVKNEESMRVPFGSNNVSLKPTSTYSNCDCLLPIKYGLDQKNRIFDDFSSEPCLHCFHQRQQKLQEEFSPKNSNPSSLNQRVNAGKTQAISTADYVPGCPCDLEEIVCKRNRFLEAWSQKVVHSPKNHQACDDESGCGDKECISNIDVVALEDSANTVKSSATSDDIGAVEIRQDRLDKKSGFHLEFIKFLNINVPKPNFLLEVSKEIDLVNNQKTLLLSQRFKSEERFDLLQSEGKEEMRKDLSHELVQITNPSSMDLERNGPLYDGNERSFTLPSLEEKVFNNSNNAVPSTLKNSNSNPKQNSLNLKVAMNVVNNIKTNSTPTMLKSSLKGNDCVSLLESFSDDPSDRSFYRNPEKCSEIVIEDESLHEINSCSRASHLLSPPQKTNDPILGLMTKRTSGKSQLKEGSSCIKAQRITLDQNSRVRSASTREKTKEVSIRPSCSKITDYNMEPGLSKATLNSPSTVMELTFSSDLKSNQLKMPTINVNTLFEQENINISSSQQSVSHFSQSNPCITEDSRCSRVHSEESEIDETYIDNWLKEPSVGEISDSQIFDEMPALMEVDNFFIRVENPRSLVGETPGDLEGLKHQGQYGGSEVEIITEKAITRENAAISTMGNVGVKPEITPVKSGVVSTFDNHFLDSELTNDQIESSELISYRGNGISVIRGSMDTGKKKINHESPLLPPELYPESITEANSAHPMPTNLPINESLNRITPISFSKLAQSTNKEKNNSNYSAKVKKEKKNFKFRPLCNKKEIIQKRKSHIMVSPNNLNISSYSFPCPMCSEVFSKHNLLLKHLGDHTKNQTSRELSFVSRSDLEVNIPISEGKQTMMEGSIAYQRENSQLITSDVAGALRVETVNEIRALIQQYLTVNDSGSFSGGCKSFRCPACFKLFSDWFEVASHIVLKHTSLSYKWPLCYLFSREKFVQLTGKCLDGLKSTCSPTPPPQLAVSAVQPLNVCEHCSQHFSSKSALIKHMIWYHNQIPKV